MNAFVMVDAKGRLLRLHQDGIEIRVQIGDEEYLLSHQDRIDLARFLLSGVTELEPVVEKLQDKSHLFEPLPLEDAVEDKKPSHVTEGHSFFGRAADKLVLSGDDPLAIARAKADEHKARKDADKARTARRDEAHVTEESLVSAEP